MSQLKPPNRVGYQGLLIAFVGLLLVTSGLARHGLPFSLPTFLVGVYLVGTGAYVTFYARLVGQHPFRNRTVVRLTLSTIIAMAGLVFGTALIDANVSCCPDTYSTVLNAVADIAFFLGIGLFGLIFVVAIVRRLLKHENR